MLPSQKANAAKRGAALAILKGRYIRCRIRDGNLSLQLLYQFVNFM